MSPADPNNHRTDSRHSRSLTEVRSAAGVPTSGRSGSLRSPAEQTSASGITPAFAWRVFRQWWMFVIPAGVLLAGFAGAAVWYFYVPQYEAKALVLIEEMTPYIAFNQQDGAKSASEKYVQTQIELLKSSLVLGPVLSRPEVATIKDLARQGDKLKHLQANLFIKQVGKSELYNVSYTGPSAKGAATVVNEVLKQYMTEQIAEDFQRSQRVIDILEEERLRREAEVERLRKNVIDLAKDLTGRDPFGQNAVTDYQRSMSPAGLIYQSLTEADVSIEVLNAEIQSLREAKVVSSDNTDTASLLDLEVATRPEVQQAQSEIDALQLALDGRIAHVRTTRVDGHWEKDRGAAMLTTDLDVRKKRFTELKSALRTQLQASRKNTAKAQRELEIATKTKERANFLARRNELSKRFKEHVGDLKDNEGISAKLEFAKAELSREEGVFELIAARTLALQTELRAPARVRLRQEATPPMLPLVPIPYKEIVLASLISLVLPLGLAVAREMTVRRIGDSDELRHVSRVPLMGEVARFPVRPTASRVLALPHRARRQMYIFAESIDSLRTNLVLCEDFGKHQVLAVTSASSGEGKTSVATSLAASVAAATKEKTLLIDADLRSPDVDSMLGVKSHPGLSDVLATNASLESAIHRVGETNTFVLPAGRTKINPHHYVDSERIADILATLRKEFHTIIIDTPPILGASEALVYAKQADMVLYCSLTDVSRSRQVKTAMDRLHRAGANVVGSVLSGVSLSRYPLAYGYDEDPTS